MADIWDQVATALYPDVERAIWLHRQRPEMVEMGSEIERAFAIYWITALSLGGMTVMLRRPGEPVAPKTYFLNPQFEIGSYRVDFLFGMSTRPELKDCMVIECDGHEWHEKTKEQAARDKARDRYLQTRFGGVVHFTGSEIFKDANLCLTDAFKVLNVINTRSEVEE
jgi:very-short-patch-repair endonuclease